MSYNAESIESLDYFEHIRRYPGMYIGSKDAKGLLHCVKEIVSNSIDEYLNGSCTKIDVTIKKDGGIEIKDNGRGIPHGLTKAGYTALFACFGVQSSGGKFNNATGESGYNTSGGEHGTGAKAVNALSKKLIVSTSRDGEKETIEFSKGKKISEKTEKDKDHGVDVIFYPDETILEVVKFDSAAIAKMLKEFSFLCKGLIFTFVDEIENKTETFISKNGLYDYLNYLSDGKSLICKPLYFESADNSFQVEAAIGYNSTYSSTIKLYTNNIPQEKGTHLTGFKTAWTSNLNSFAREKKWLKDKDSNLTGSDFDEGLILILNFKMIDPVFKGQNKEELSSSEGRTYVQKLTTQALKNLFITNEKDFKIIIDKALSARKAREAAKKARDAARKPKEKGLRAKIQLSDKFIDCKNKTPKDRNLIVVEGLSAGSSSIEARNPNTDAIYMLRGKILSVLKSDYDKVLKNQVLSDLIQVIGAGVASSFDASKMNFDKVVIAADSDADGGSIELLLITFFFTYMKDLVLKGKLYRAVTPLYIVHQTSGEPIYFYTDSEYRAWLDKGGNKDSVLRCKGLGELDAAQLHEVCFKNQRFKRITVEDAAAAEDLLDVLMGKKAEKRKQYIYDNAEHFGFNFM